MRERGNRRERDIRYGREVCVRERERGNTVTEGQKEDRFEENV